MIASAERANAASIWLGFVAVNILHQIWAIAATLLVELIFDILTERTKSPIGARGGSFLLACI